MTTIYCLMLMLCPYISLCQPPAQIPNSKPAMVNAKPATIHPLAIGDKIPDIEFSQMVNSKWSTLKLSQLKGKLIILDFWATWCTNCIKKFPLLDSLQRRHTDQLQVILVNTAGTGDTREKLLKYFTRYADKTGSSLILPAVYNDTATAGYFPHSFIPHYVWISPGGRFMLATGPDEITAANILAAISGHTPAMAGLGLMDSFDFQKPLFVNNNAGNGQGMIFRSTLAGYIPGMITAARYRRNSNRLTTRYTIINLPLLELVKLAYRTDTPDQCIQVYAADSLCNMIFPRSDTERIKYSFTYELLTPPVPHTMALQYIRQDLERYFGITARLTNETFNIYQSPKQLQQ
jgi:thiol-disulfide isomerase/thioredoxin